MSDYSHRVAQEIENYRRVENIHDLPDIFHYWSNKFLGRHVQQVFGFDNLHEVFASELSASISAANGNPSILSIGAGDGCVEIALAKRMLAAGAAPFRFLCIELNPHLAARGRAAAAAAGVSEHVVFEVADLSVWDTSQRFGAAFAHHSLHHIEALERVFDLVRRTLDDRASFVMFDMIGRNGHMRWPETLALIERLWTVIPARYKHHHLFGRTVDPYENWDCSGESFEGIRAQDIMSTLTERFHFIKMCVWGGVLDPFIDRGYGHNLDPANAADAAFVDHLWHLDCALVAARATTPTQVVAVMQKEPAMQLVSSFALTPRDCIHEG